MKIYAQHGFGEGEKVFQGATSGYIDGVIYSPKDISLERLRERLSNTSLAGVDRLFDPQYYLALRASDPSCRLGSLVNDYTDYFRPRRRTELESEINVEADLNACLGFQVSLPVTGVIAPNVLIPASFNSIEAAIAKNFIRKTKRAFTATGDQRKVFATLAASIDALMDPNELQEFLNDITALENRPDGFYVLIAPKNTDARFDIFHADVLARWMLINHALRINGYEVINGYSDLVSPFLGAVGAHAGATGWWSNLRFFSQERFGGTNNIARQPIPKYLSLALLNRITFQELDALRADVPEVVNGLASDALYDAGRGSEPERNQEVLQSWEALKHLANGTVTGDLITSLGNLLGRITAARDAYALARARFDLDEKSREHHLAPLEAGIRSFCELAEINLP